jgi:ATP-dependent 26S proteasome regulatory subunit
MLLVLRGNCSLSLETNSNFVWRYDAHSGGEREIQRTMLELLNQLDGFDSRGDVKVIMATNRIETLDPALIRPGKHMTVEFVDVC